MFKYIKQNKNIIVTAVAMFIVSVSVLMFFFSANTEIAPHDIKTDIIEGINVKLPQENESKFRKLLNNNKDSVLAVALNGDIEFASWDFESILGYKQEEILHKSFFTLLNPEDLSDFLGAFGRVMESHQQVNTIGPYRIRDAGGKYHIHIGSATPLLEKDKIRQIIISTKDITDELNEKQDLKQKNSEEKSILQQENKAEIKIIAEKKK